MGYLSEGHWVDVPGTGLYLEMRHSSVNCQAAELQRLSIEIHSQLSEKLVLVCP